MNLNLIMFILFKLKLPKEIIIKIINNNLYKHKQFSKNIIKYNNVLKSFKPIIKTKFLKPFIIILPPKFNYNNNRLIKFIYKFYNKNIITYNYVNKEKSSDFILNLYNNELLPMYKYI